VDNTASGTSLKLQALFISFMRDFQRTKLYRFEADVLEKHPLNKILTLNECIKLARKYNPEIVVKDGRGRRHAGASFEEQLITLPIWSRQTVIVLHEVAHTLVNDYKYPHHGAEFVGTLIGLLSNESINDVSFNMIKFGETKLKYSKNWINWALKLPYAKTNNSDSLSN
tara:strand:- start:1257 stop:1763 length:507 start_codon:yes stop_codon:yes gene_type:complete